MHGMSKHPAYNVWRELRNRCEVANHKWYPSYGGRGIAVCDQWSISFIDFWEDMGGSYSSGLLIDRIDNNGPYTKENCRWVPMSESNSNKRSPKTKEMPTGVSLFQDKYWRARIKIEKKEYHIGYYKQKTEAMLAYKKMHSEWYGY